MKSLDFRRYAVSCVAAAMLAACGGSQPPIGATGPNVTLQRSISKGSHGEYDTTGPLLYVTNFIAWTVTVYHANSKDPAPIATISQDLDSPNGACVDGQGTLYIPNEPDSGPGWVSEYPLGKTTASRVITKWS